MGKKCNKPKSNTSKRVRLKTKYSIKKKVKEHNKKMNREARKISNLGLPHRKHDNDQRLPNSYPFKAQVIEAAEARQVYEKELKTTLRAQRKNKIAEQKVIADLEEYENQHKEMKKNEVGYQTKKEQRQEQLKTNKEQQISHLKQIVKDSQVVLILSDSRQPIGSEIQNTLELKGKQVIHVLTKCDLVGIKNLKDWNAYYQTKKQTMYLYQGKAGHAQSSEVMRRDQLLQKLSIIQTQKKKKITVAVVGYPQSGKRTLVAQLGQTGDNIVIQTPGLIDDSHINYQDRILRGMSTQIGNLDTQTCVEKVLNMVSDQKQLMLMYRIPQFINHKHFLISVAQMHTTKKGASDIEGAARLVLADWVEGRIKYHTEPPSSS